MMLKGYKTLIFNAVMLIGGALGYTVTPELAEQYSEAIILVGGLLFAGGNIVLRLVTTGPIFNKKPAAKPRKQRAKSSAVIGLLVLMLAGAGLVACATPVAETPAQRMFAIGKDLNTAQTLILSFFESSYATPEAKAYIKKLEAAATDAFFAASHAVEQGDDPKVPALIATARHAVNEILLYLRTSGWQPPPRTAWSAIADTEASAVARTPLTVLED